MTPPPVAGGASIYRAPSAKQRALTPESVGFASGSQPHDYRRPCRALTFSIALQGSFPTRP